MSIINDDTPTTMNNKLIENSESKAESNSREMMINQDHNATNLSNQRFGDREFTDNEIESEIESMIEARKHCIYNVKRYCYHI